MHVARYIALFACLNAVSATAQTAIRVRADNDAFNFWQPPWARPDEEYTSGVRLSADYAGSPFWSRTHTGVHTQTWTFGQDIFTPTSERRAGARANAGVLWVQSAEQSISEHKTEERSITIGVTGEPSLASTMQRIVHGYSAAWQRPIDWTEQLPFEPVFNVAYDQERRTSVARIPLAPHAGFSAGNLLTEARAGIGARGGWTHVSFISDATLRAVVWNETLSGNLFRSSERRALRFLVPELQFGMSARVGRATISYAVHQRGAEYSGRAAPHWWSLIQTQWRFDK